MKVEVIADSINGAIRLSTLRIEMPQAMVGELQAIRELSITRKRWTDTKELLRATDAFEFTPSLGTTMTVFGVRSACDRWRETRMAALDQAHKLSTSREPPPITFIEHIVRPYAPVSLLVSSTHWKVAADHLQTSDETMVILLGRLINVALSSSSPRRVEAGDWHLPYTSIEDADVSIGNVVNDHGLEVLLTDKLDDLCHQLLLRVSIARCLRLGPSTHSDPRERIKNDLALFSTDGQNTVRTRPDAYDHQATPDTIHEGSWRNANLHGNLTGWVQYRQVAKWELWRTAKT